MLATALLTLACLAPALQAQTLSPALIVKTAKKGDYEPLRLTSLHVTSRIVSNVATTTMDMTFLNEKDRVLEGRLVFPLPEGATLCRFALDIEGRLREGVIVARDKGRAVFESTVRRQIDPGLLEWVKGNNFRARIYPLPARGTRRIVVAYEQEMPRTEKGLLYRLPLHFRKPVGSFTLDMAVAGPGLSPSFSLSPFEKLGFRVEDDAHVAVTHFDDMTVEGDIAVSVARKDPATEVYVHHHRKGDYFYVVHRPEAATRPRALPRSVIVLWDASASARDRDLPREIRLLESYLRTLENPALGLVPFAHEAGPLERFEGKQAVERLLERVRSLPRDGATRLGALDLAAWEKEADEFLLFTDGNGNFGSRELRPGSRPVRVFSSAPAADHALLRHLADRTGGEYFNLLRASDPEVLRRLATEAFRFLSAAGQTAADLRPALPRRVNGPYTVAGRLLRPGGTLVLRYGFGREVTETCEVDLSAAVEDTSGAVARIWARREMERLSAPGAGDEAEKALLEVGRAFGIVTPATSLIVLDSIEDYVRHAIIPPEDMQEEYWKIVELGKQEERARREAKITEVLARWKKLEAWWEKVFRYPKDLRVAGKSKKEAEGPAFGGGGEAPGAESEDGAEGGPRMAEERRLAEGAASKEKKGGGEGGGGIRLAKWDPKTPYLAELRKAGPDEAYEVYLGQREKYEDSSAFFLDVSDFFFEAGRADLGLRVLSNIAEMEIENHQLLRILGHRLAQAGRLGLAEAVFRHVLALRPEEPQSCRDLALVLARRERFAEAVELLYRVVLGSWDGRFPEIDQIALVEMNRIIHRARARGVESFPVDPRFLRLIDVDLRILLSWDADNCDMDLWVIEPSGEKCFYSNRSTRIGGRMSCDFTGGYGPEEYMVRRAMPGVYKIQVNYYGNSQQVLAGATTIQVWVVKNYGRPDEERISLTRRLRDQKEVLTIGEVTFAEAGAGPDGGKKGEEEGR